MPEATFADSPHRPSSFASLASWGTLTLATAQDDHRRVLAVLAAL